MKFILVSLCFFMHAGENKLFKEVPQDQIKYLAGVFLSHNFANQSQALPTLQSFITDFYETNPVFHYMTEKSSTEESIQLIGACQLYFIEYQKYLFNLLYHPYNPFLKLKSWLTRNRAKEQLKTALIFNKEIQLTNKVDEEFETCAELIQKMARELIVPCESKPLIKS